MYPINQFNESMAVPPTSVGMNILYHEILWNTCPELPSAPTWWKHTCEGECKSQLHASIHIYGANTVPELIINGLRERIPIRTS
jgi:hypothetical protein